jgi:hypothetical protein
MGVCVDVDSWVNLIKVPPATAMRVLMLIADGDKRPPFHVEAPCIHTKSDTSSSCVFLFTPDIFLCEVASEENAKEKTR